MRFPKKKVSARATALALVLGVVGVLLTALPASAATVSVVHARLWRRGHDVVTRHGLRIHRGPTVTGVTFIGGVTATADRVTASTTPQLTATVPVRRDRRRDRITVDDRRRRHPRAQRNFDGRRPSLAPTITSFTPPSGAVGSSVIITGTNLCGATPGRVQRHARDLRRHLATRRSPRRCRPEPRAVRLHVTTSGQLTRRTARPASRSRVFRRSRRSRRRADRSGRA